MVASRLPSTLELIHHFRSRCWFGGAHRAHPRRRRSSRATPLLAPHPRRAISTLGANSRSQRHNGRVSGTRLPFGLTNDALAAAMAEEDPESLAAASRMRAGYGPELAAAALTSGHAAPPGTAQVRRGCSRDVLHQSRFGAGDPTEVADYHASRFLQMGVRRVIDLGCGIGSDSMAFARAGGGRGGGCRSRHSRGRAGQPRRPC